MFLRILIIPLRQIVKPYRKPPCQGLMTVPKDSKDGTLFRFIEIVALVQIRKMEIFLAQF